MKRIIFNKTYIKTLGRRIRDKRHSDGLSLVKAAKQMGLRGPTLWHIEQGAMPRLDKYIKIHRWLY